MRDASPTTAQGTSWTPPLSEVCFQSSQWGVSEPETVVQWNVWLCTCGLQTWSHSFSPITVWHSLPAEDVSLWCPESVLENRSPGHRQRGLWRCPWQYKRAAQLINLQPKTCHSQDTASWNNFLWVEFVLSQFWLAFAGPWDIVAPWQLTQKGEQLSSLLYLFCEVSFDRMEPLSTDSNPLFERKD